MKNYVLTFLLALLVVLAAVTIRRSLLGTTPSVGPGPTLVSMGGDPVPIPPMVSMGGDPVPIPPRGARAR